MKSSRFQLSIVDAPLLMAFSAMLGTVMAKTCNLLVAFFGTLFH